VTVVWKDGRREASEVLQASGSLARPLSDEALHAKFRALVEPVLPGTSASLLATVLAVGIDAGPTDISAGIEAATSSPSGTASARE
jgi:hypothetical protein